MQTVDADPVQEAEIFALGPNASEARPVRPVRRSRRPFMETRSLPVGLLRFSGEPKDGGATEDDWSAG